MVQMVDLLSDSPLDHCHHGAAPSPTLVKVCKHVDPVGVWSSHTDEAIVTPDASPTNPNRFQALEMCKINGIRDVQN